MCVSGFREQYTLPKLEGPCRRKILKPQQDAKRLFLPPFRHVSSSSFLRQKVHTSPHSNPSLYTKTMQSLWATASLVLSGLKHRALTM